MIVHHSEKWTGSTLYADNVKSVLARYAKKWTDLPKFIERLTLIDDKNGSLDISFQEFKRIQNIKSDIYVTLFEEFDDEKSDEVLT